MDLEVKRLFARERTTAHIHLLDRRFGRDVEVEDVHRQPERHACVRDLQGVFQLRVPEKGRA
jgi:hypothetical protein